MEKVKEVGYIDGDSVMTRRPHLSYYSGLHFVMAPTSPMSFNSLYAYSIQNRVKFIWIDGIVVRMHPIFEYMVQNMQNYPYFIPIVVIPEGVLYQVVANEKR